MTCCECKKNSSKYWFSRTKYSTFASRKM